MWNSPAPSLLGDGGGIVEDPLKEMVAVAFEASLTTVAVASNVPALLGAKVIPIGVLCPAARVTGSVGEVSKKIWLLMATLLITIAALPEFVAVKVVPFVLPTGTLTKLTLVLPKVRLLGSDLPEVVAVWLELPVLTPWQPIRKVRAKSESAPAARRRALPECSRPRFCRIRQPWNRFLAFQIDWAEGTAHHQSVTRRGTYIEF